MALVQFRCARIDFARINSKLVLWPQRFDAKYAKAFARRRRDTTITISAEAGGRVDVGGNFDGNCLRMLLLALETHLRLVETVGMRRPRPASVRSISADASERLKANGRLTRRDH